MKKSILLAFSLCIFCTSSIFAQQNDSTTIVEKTSTTLDEDENSVKVQRHTLMSRFDKEIASSEKERMLKRQKRIADIAYKSSVLDTLDISERKRRILFHDLKHKPYSDRLNKAVLADTKFEDDDSN